MGDNEDFMKVIRHGEDKLKDWTFCNTHFPELTKDSEDWDIGGKFNYIYHRFNYSFGGRNLIHMLENTPTYKKRVFICLSLEYSKSINSNLYSNLDKLISDNWDNK